MALTDTLIRSEKYDGKRKKLRDGNGLFLHVMPSGKYWRYDYRFDGKRKTLSIGVYPEVTLKEARIRLYAAKEQLGQGVDPSYYKRLAKYVNDDHRFEAVAREWLAQHDCGDTSRHDIKLRLEKDVFPVIGDRLVQTIQPADIIHIIRRIESRGAEDLPGRVSRNISQVMRYAVALSLVPSDPCRDLKGAIKAKKNTKRYPAITDPGEFGKLLRAIEAYDHTIIMGYALKIAPHVALRPSELREAPWSEIDLPGRLWNIPASRMKKDRPHYVPLSDQMVKLLESLEPITGKTGLLFPSPMVRKPRKAFSENGMNYALNRIGYPGSVHCPHGFRSSFSTIANRAGAFSPDAIEAQLAHVDKDRVRAAYNRADHYEARVKLMQWWSDQIDIMRQNAPASA